MYISKNEVKSITGPAGMIQEEATTMPRGMEHISDEKRLKELGCSDQRKESSRELSYGILNRGL